MRQHIENPSSLEQKSWEKAPFIERRVEERGELIIVRKKEEFDIVQELKKKEGPFWEIAGPTDTGFPFHPFQDTTPFEQIKELDLLKLISDKKIYTSNLYKGVPTFKTGEFVGFEGSTHFRADARTLPAKEATLDAIFCSSIGIITPRGVKEMIEKGVEKEIPRSEQKRIGETDTITPETTREQDKLRKNVIKEATRVLRTGGLLIWDGAKKEDLNHAADAGLNVVHYEMRALKGWTRYSAIFIKGGD